MADEATTRALLDQLVDAIVECDADGAKAKAEELLRQGADPVMALKATLTRQPRS